MKGRFEPDYRPWIAEFGFNCSAIRGMVGVLKVSDQASGVRGLALRGV